MINNESSTIERLNHAWTTLIAINRVVKKKVSSEIYKALQDSINEIARCQTKLGISKLRDNPDWYNAFKEIEKELDKEGALEDWMEAHL